LGEHADLLGWYKASFDGGRVAIGLLRHCSNDVKITTLASKQAISVMSCEVRGLLLLLLASLLSCWDESMVL
jgi:hypothetical protein